MAVTWVYDQSDPALMLWTAALHRFNMPFHAGQHILELGCAETDWLERMHAADSSFVLTGVDARLQQREARGFTLSVGNACDPALFPDGSFDWIVLLGALEHFGLGFYGDPIDPDGDVHTLENIARWLKPGGFVYFDVPCQPTFRQTRHFRSYAPADIQGRLMPPGLTELNRAYSLPEPHAGTWCLEPTTDRVPYWYVAVLAQKASCS